jgi:hypothetical protein
VKIKLFLTVRADGRHKPPGIYQIPPELIKAGGRTIRSELHKLLNSILNKEELSEK